MTEDTYYTKVTSADGGISFSPVKIISRETGDVTMARPQIERFMPNLHEKYYAIVRAVVREFAWENDGMDREYYNTFNCFSTRVLAVRACSMRSRDAAIATACLRMDPDYEPDWDNAQSKKHFVFYDHRERTWKKDWWMQGRYTTAVVSSEEKANQVCELLTGWGIK